jgi:uncharacterized membrane protein SpoIIM required for sporulation
MARRQDHFVAGQKPAWDELEALLVVGDGRSLPPASISRLARLYRVVCTDLMRARGAGYTSDLVAYLDGLAARGHNVLYRARPRSLADAVEFLLRGFPRQVRASGRFQLAALFAFAVPLLVAGIGAYASPEFAAGILPTSQLVAMEEMYADPLDGREVGQNAEMAGFYVWNNVGIAFRCFATGILLGLGSLFFLVYNGIVIGATLGWVVAAGHGTNILTFVAGHGSFELTAIVIAGGAGIQMGYALVETGGRTRVGSLQAQAPALVRLVSGAGVMLVIAAGIEGFWSPSAAPYPVKWIVAALLWVGVLAYLLLAGRRGELRGGAPSVGGGTR